MASMAAGSRAEAAEVVGEAPRPMSVGLPSHMRALRPRGAMDLWSEGLVERCTPLSSATDAEEPSSAPADWAMHESELAAGSRVARRIVAHGRSQHGGLRAVGELLGGYIQRNV